MEMLLADLGIPVFFFLCYLVLMTISLATDSPIWGLLFSVCIIALGYKFHNTIVWFFWENKVSLLFASVGYMSFGLTYSFVRWRWVHEDAISEFRKLNRSFRRPRLAEYKQEIACWILYWPLSITGKLAQWFFMDFAQNIVQRFRKTYMKIGLDAYRSLSPEELEKIRFNDWKEED